MIKKERGKPSINIDHFNKDQFNEEELKEMEDKIKYHDDVNKRWVDYQVNFTKKI
jgi:hypothetical protein